MVTSEGKGRYLIYNSKTENNTKSFKSFSEQCDVINCKLVDETLLQCLSSNRSLLEALRKCCVKSEKSLVAAD